MDLAEAFTSPAEAAFAFMVSMLVYATSVPSYIKTWLDELCEALPKFLSSLPDVLALFALFGLGGLVSVAKLVVYIINPFLYLIILKVLFDWEVSRISQAVVGMGPSSQPQIVWSRVTVPEREGWSIGITIIALPLGWIVQWAVWMTLWMCAKVMKLRACRPGRLRQSESVGGEER
ncbi:hypothetical protein LTR37_003896 [Vermiconidia calcicola]|uniref:Uncharacterized protein n=1 Tax=Vermiconidia calcicola TaxID=1690605 RepID=A0ACC3NQ12_9PEZI|nr:hypothetical protein LTR37_003896 [Vermiconidia calcicola]